MLKMMIADRFADEFHQRQNCEPFLDIRLLAEKIDPLVNAKRPLGAVWFLLFSDKSVALTAADSLPLIGMMTEDGRIET